MSSTGDRRETFLRRATWHYATACILTSGVPSFSS
jgi:hypothetical protein